MTARSTVFRVLFALAIGVGTVAISTGASGIAVLCVVFALALHIVRKRLGGSKRQEGETAMVKAVQRRRFE